ncbi:hypothetical protein C8263_17770 [Deinococcus arcticus]|uniref:Uncharacterized protein n=1 Tax=Deinococcus arcticus TaxID=2136176 RepID=A0A2T3W3V3_9DEIO|nr:hypothetical protein C8263_17770 [Deinococcus arcticus]
MFFVDSHNLEIIDKYGNIHMDFLILTVSELELQYSSLLVDRNIFGVLLVTPHAFDHFFHH